MPGIRRPKHFSTLNNNNTEETLYCDRCYAVGKPCILGPRIYKDKEIIPTDADNWRQCHTCGQVYPRHAAKNLGESEASDIVPVSNPFGMHNTKMETAPFSQHGKKYFNKRNKLLNDRLNKPANRYIISSKDDLDQYQKDEDLQFFKRQGDIVKNVKNV